MLTKHGDHEALLISAILIYTTSLIALIRMMNTIKNDMKWYDDMKLQMLPVKKKSLWCSTQYFAMYTLSFQPEVIMCCNAIGQKSVHIDNDTKQNKTAFFVVYSEIS